MRPLPSFKFIALKPLIPSLSSLSSSLSYKFIPVDNSGFADTCRTGKQTADGAGVLRERYSWV